MLHVFLLSLSSLSHHEWRIMVISTWWLVVKIGLLFTIVVP